MTSRPCFIYRRPGTLFCARRCRQRAWCPSERAVAAALGWWVPSASGGQRRFHSSSSQWLMTVCGRRLPWWQARRTWRSSLAPAPSAPGHRWCAPPLLLLCTHGSRTYISIPNVSSILSSPLDSIEKLQNIYAPVEHLAHTLLVHNRKML